MLRVMGRLLLLLRHQDLLRLIDGLLLLLRNHRLLGVNGRHGLSDLPASIVLLIRLSLLLRELAVRGIGIVLSVNGRILPAYVALLLSRMGRQGQRLESLLKL